MNVFEKHNPVDETDKSKLELQPLVYDSSSHKEEIDLPYSTEQLFDLVADIERYPEFLPGWKSVRIHKIEGNKLFVEQDIGFPLFSFKVDSVATLNRPHHISINIDGSSFGHQEIEWGFDSITSSLTHVSLSIKMDLDPGPHRLILQLYVNNSIGSMLEYFERRANDVLKAK